MLVWIALVCGLVSAWTYAVYAVDKAAARERRARVSERTLHLLAFVGGWPGALLAQKTLRHKTRKLKFQLIFWLTGLFQFSALCAWLMRN